MTGSQSPVQVIRWPHEPICVFCIRPLAACGYRSCVCDACGSIYPQTPKKTPSAYGWASYGILGYYN
jgi:hypothetical protein